jgi:hypothetical protein
MIQGSLGTLRERAMCSKATDVWKDVWAIALAFLLLVHP